MFLFTREKKVSEFIQSHMNKVDECLQLTKQTVDQYFAEKYEHAEELANNVDVLETEADKIMRKVTDQLFQGAFLPTIRQDIHILISEMDKVSNATETVCDFIIGQGPSVPEELQSEIKSIYTKTLDQFNHIIEAIKLLTEKSGSEADKIREHTKKAGIIESEIDEIEYRLTKTIFISKRELAHKMHLHTWVRLSCHLSDQIEDLGDNLNLLVLKAKI